MKVYDYDVDGSRHCREGVATEERPGIYLDTFWGTYGSSERHRLSGMEEASLRERFDTDDFEELDRNRHGNHGQWMRFAPADRKTIPSQHGLQVRYFIRRDATPDLATQIENAKEKVAQAEGEVERAASRLQWARADLAALEALQ